MVKFTFTLPWQSPQNGGLRHNHRSWTNSAVWRATWTPILFRQFLVTRLMFTHGQFIQKRGWWEQMQSGCMLRIPALSGKIKDNRFCRLMGNLNSNFIPTILGGTSYVHAGPTYSKGWLMRTDAIWMYVTRPCCKWKDKNEHRIKAKELKQISQSKLESNFGLELYRCD